MVVATSQKQFFAAHRCSSRARTEFHDLFRLGCQHVHPTLLFPLPSLFKSILGGACPTAPASVVLRTPWLFDLRCVGLASASHDIRWRRSTLVLLNVPYWRTPEESLTASFARIELPEEFHAGIDDNNNADIVDFVFSELRIEWNAPAEISKAHHVRGYSLQVTVITDEPDTKRAYWYWANQDP